MPLTLDKNGKPPTGTIDGSTIPADLTFQCVNEFVHDINTHFEELQALCLGLANELDKARKKPNCNNCANRGLLNELSQETFCEQCVWSGAFRENHFKATI